DPDIIPWEKWDRAMDAPIGYPREPRDYARPSSRQMFQDLKDAGIKAVVALRNRDTELRPVWSPAVPTSQTDWNEWWEYVFAMVYWLNVRNDFRVDDFEVLNEPDIPRGQGWTGTQRQYFEMIKATKNAVGHVYRKYLPGRRYYVCAPVSAEGNWVRPTLTVAGPYFNGLSVHSYEKNLQGFIRAMHSELKRSGRPRYPLWITEWGTYTTGYEGMELSLSVVSNLIRGSRPGDDYVYGSHIFSFYDWGPHFDGLVDGKGSRAKAYYAMRLANRALQGGRPTFKTSCSLSRLLAITTKDPDGKVNLLVVNEGNTRYRAKADLSGLLTSGTGTLWQFSADVPDERVGEVALTEGVSEFDIPRRAAILVKYAPAAGGPAEASGVPDAGDASGRGH
ncbi:MAG: hypothetical protein ACYS8L_08090, partial [Planctomycetota bacterium]